MLDSNQIDLKRKLIEATDAVRKKFNLLKQTRTLNKSELEELYEPVTTRLKTISEAFQQTKPEISKEIKSDKKHVKLSEYSENINLDNTIFPPSPFSTNAADDEYFSTPVTDDRSKVGVEQRKLTVSSGSRSPHIATDYLEKLKISNKGFDITYGIYRDLNNKFKMGDTEVRFPPGKISLWRKNQKIGTYPATDDLLQLIFLKKPDALNDPKSLSDETKKSYKEILLNTNVLYRNFNPVNNRNDSRQKKYIELILPLVGKKGGVLTKLPNKKFINARERQTDYIYWNNEKELVDRLRLLWSSKSAGNTGHDNEILSIIDELREEGIIY